MVLLKESISDGTSESAACAALSLMVGECCACAVICSEDSRPAEDVSRTYWSVPSAEFQGTAGPSISTVGDDCFQVILPDLSRPGQLFAVARITGVSGAVVERLAQLAWRNVTLHQQVAAQPKHLDQSSDSLNRDEDQRLPEDGGNLTVGVIRALANAVDARDPFSRGHSDRVARMAAELGRLLQLSPEECQQLLITGLLLDIGKLGISDSVLQDPARLSFEQFEIVKQHTVIGYQILRSVTGLEFALPGVLHHHESFDGNGYPHGLAGTQIPLFARILAVVDTYDAMTSDRPFRQGSSFEAVEARLQNSSGRFWDPVVVEAFLKKKEVFRSICQEAGAAHNPLHVDAAEVITAEECSEKPRCHPNAAVTLVPQGRDFSRTVVVMPRAAASESSVAEELLQ